MLKEVLFVPHILMRWMCYPTTFAGKIQNSRWLLKLHHFACSNPDSFLEIIHVHSFCVTSNKSCVVDRQLFSMHSPIYLLCGKPLVANNHVQTHETFFLLAAFLRTFAGKGICLITSLASLALGIWKVA